MNGHKETIHNKQKVEATDEWGNTTQGMYTVGYYSTIKKNEVQMHVTARLSLEDIRPRERNQSGETTCFKTLSILNDQNRKILGDKK